MEFLERENGELYCEHDSIYRRNFPVYLRYKDDTNNIREQWKIFCRKLYSNILKIEKELEKEIEDSFKKDLTYFDRRDMKKKITKCDDYKKKIINSVKVKIFEIESDDVEVIESKGFEHYFKYYNGAI